MSKWFPHLENKKRAIGVVVGVLALGGVGIFFFRAKEPSVSQEEVKEVRVESSPSHSIFSSLREAFRSVQFNVDEIRRLDLENARLRLENAQLRLRLESSSFEASVEKARELTEVYSAQLERGAGNRVARTLASIQYRSPTHLLPHQLHALGVTQFQAQEFERAAKNFTVLAEMSKEAGYQTPAHWLLTGLVWYRLRNWEMAETYFDRVLSSAPRPTDDAQLKAMAQARLWKALVAEQRQEKKKSQALMRDLVDHHPQSPEASWVNISHQTGGHRDRAPASKD